MAIKYIDLVNGNDANDGSSWAQAIKSLPITGDDEIRVAETPAYSLGQTAQWTNKNNTVVLSSAVTKNIDDAVGNTWSVVSPVAGSTNSVRKFGATAQRFYMRTTVLAGKIAYKQLPTTEDFSAYTKISFWFHAATYNTHANTAAFSICLCSDANGDVVVNSLPFPTLYNGGNYNYHVLELDNGAALGSSINSIAIYAANNQPGNYYISINHIIACNSLSLKSLIGISPNQETDYFCIQSISGVNIVLDNYAGLPEEGLGYTGETEETTLYYRQPITLQYLYGTGYAVNIQESGSYKFGWNKANNVQTGETWVDGVCYYNYCVYAYTSNKYPTIENLGIVRYSGCIIKNFNEIKNIQYTGNASSFNIDGDGILINKINVHNSCNTDAVIVFKVTNSRPLEIKNIIARYNFGSPLITEGTVTIFSTGVIYENIFVDNNSLYGITIFFTYSSNYGMGESNVFLNPISTNHLYSDLTIYSPFNTLINLVAQKLNFVATTYLRDTDTTGMTISSSFKNPVYEFNRNKIEGAYKVSYSNAFYMEWQTAIKHDTEVGAWKIYSSSAYMFPQDGNPTFRIFKIAEIAVEEGVPILISVWIYGSLPHSSVFGQRLLIRSLFTNVIETDCSTAIPQGEEWHNVAVSVTPVKTGVLTLEVQNISGTIYIGSINIIS